MSIIEIENLYFKHSDKTIFNNISINIAENKITALMGPSGCGKTTLLKLIGKQLIPFSGKIKVKNKDLSNISDKDLYKIRKDIGILFQNGALFSDLTVYENIAFPIREHTNLSEKLIRDLVLIKLQAVGLKNVYNLMPSELSIGMAKRTALARTIALDPSIIMYDEPFSGQDPISMATLMRLIKLLNKALKTTTIIVSHDVIETMSIADYIYIINDKCIIEEGTPAQIKKSKKEFTKYFINKTINYENINKLNDDTYEKDLFNYN
jgi:phospholipid/cholesterol/gamma-HCH transport system ATP-binding protein